MNYKMQSSILYNLTMDVKHYDIVTTQPAASKLQPVSKSSKMVVQWHLDTASVPYALQICIQPPLGYQME